MAAEVAEIPVVIDRQLRQNLDEYLALGQRWAKAPPLFFATCARGTSDQAALFFKYLTEIGTGIPVASLGPSLGTVFDGNLRMKGAALLAISQSGASPDLVALTRKSAAGGAETFALLNTIDSPLADVAGMVLPLSAGPERAVAATKSFVASLVAVAAIHAGQTGDMVLKEELLALPQALMSRMGRPRHDLHALAGKRRLFCLGRGLGLAIAGEAALKFKETCLLAAEGASTAEFRHGPLALADNDTAALVFVLDDVTRAGTEALVETLRQRGTTIATIGPDSANWGRAGLGHPATQAIAAIATFYSEVHALAVSLGLDPDIPPHLMKATLTE
ncbi:MAG TPA: SIS domain-containing protein [Albidovulum sp.]|uniref:SIS domain-containing protein n=1 Tax=Albidovulum sp. TaxID=1872424 RepID=UPI002CCD40FB|nr:SIS domain-containing protein [Albidovulum sp.]